MCEPKTGVAGGISAAKIISPEEQLADMLRDDLGIRVNPQALRLFIRWKWTAAKTLAHRIHDGY